ncbi:MAG: thioesterase [Alphaproteobacteria bacterium TMED87]|nr:thioesterase [Rhodospirillaceae bacterium]OUV10717.1 MAG: thioesterase [Alphaproteobacteria bacterium TMED87]
MVKKLKREDFLHTQKIPTRWQDNDVYHHVNNIIYYSFFDTVINKYLIDFGGLDFKKGPIIGLAVETHCEFYKPIQFPQIIDSCLRIVNLGNSSVKYEIGLFIENENECVAFGHFVHVFVKRPENKPTSIPTQLRNCMSKLIYNKQ